MTMRFQVIANGTDMGIFHAHSKDGAYTEYLRQAGYKTTEEAADVLGLTIEEFDAQIDIVAV